MKTQRRTARTIAGQAPHGLLLGALYALTGAAALVHEVAWTRIARSLLGGDARAVAVSLVAILGGMGLGGLAAPWVARRWGALGGFARVEAAAALYAAALPWIAPALDWLVGVSFRALGSGGAFTAFSALVATLLFAPPALAMGAGLPLLAQARAPAGRTPRDAGALYAVHAFGGALGGLLAAFWLMPDVGVPVAVAVASAIQIGVAVAALQLRAADRQAEAKPPARSALAAPDAKRVVVLVLGAALCAGAATAGLQTLWSRIATLAVGPSVQGFALVAAVYVLALSVGAGLAAPFARRSSTPTAVFAALVLASSAATLFGTTAVGAWPETAAQAFGSLHPGDGPPWASLAFQVAGPVFGPVALAAAAFPFGVAALGRTGRRTAARDVGWLVAAGAAGNVLGVVVITFALVPALGLARSFLAAALCLAAAGLCAASAAFRGGPGRPAMRARHALMLTGLSAVAVIALAQAPRHFDPDVLTRGPFLYAGARGPALGHVVFVHHGVESTVTVRAAGRERLLQIDGKVDASSEGDASTQILVGLLPTALASSPRDALVIGLGTGATVDAVRSVPGVQSVEVAELVDGVRWAAPRFARWNDHVLDDPRVHVRPVDGAMLLRHADRRWDVIVSEPSNPWVAGMGDLFSEQTFRAARERLADGGVFATWFHVYATDLSIVRAIAATFVEVFPDATLWELVRGQDYMLVGRRHGGAQPVHLDLDVLAARLADPAVGRRLVRAGIADAQGVLARLVTMEAGVVALGAGADVLSSRDGGLEARAARSLYSDASLEALALFAELPGTPGTMHVRASTPAGRELASALPAAMEAGGLGRTLVIRALARDEEGAIAAGERAVGLLPEDPSLREALATVYLGRGKMHALVREDADARDALYAALELEPSDGVRADALTTLGDLHLQSQQPQLALARYQAARRLRPGMIELTERIADCLEELGAADDARRERRLAERLWREERRL